MRSGYWITVLVVVIVLVGGLALLGKSSNQSGNSTVVPGIGGGPGASPSAQTIVIEYSSDGFNPKTVNIKAGQRVTWVNKDTDELQIASNPHPTHTDYSPLNSVGVIQPGSSKSFTFPTVGTFGYHNHLEPNKTGEIIVE